MERVLNVSKLILVKNVKFVFVKMAELVMMINVFVIQILPEYGVKFETMKHSFVINLHLRKIKMLMLFFVKLE
jgi:hypothetical protein